MLASGTIVVEEARTPEALHQARAIRHQVFADEQGIPAALVHDGHDAAARHALALCDGAPAATGRLMVAPDGTGVLARIAVLPAYRGRGLGRRIVEHLETLARHQGIDTVTLKPHHYLEAFYARMGYVTVPGSFTTVGPHPLITMTKALR